MKILVAHNQYQHPGGEDAVCASEITLLRRAGHQVVEYVRHNNEIHGYSFLERVSLGWRASWSKSAFREMRAILASESPDVAHFHNTFPLISPSAYYACRAAGVPVVQTLHNFRLLCPGGNLFRDGRICEDCVSRSLLHSMIHGCYQESRIKTAAVAGMLTLHGLLRTWEKQVDLFFVCNDFARKKFIEAGMNEACLRVKPNFIATDPGIGSVTKNTVLFLGRLSQEKGPQLLPLAWSKLASRIPLEIAGEGPLRVSLQADCARRDLRSVSFSGWLDAGTAMDRLHSAKFLIVPSVCYEGFPLVVAEAYACGVPVIAAGHGGLAEIVRDGSTGLQFAPGDAGDLAAKVAWAWAHPSEMATMGRAARAEFETKYTSEIALSHLEAGYEFALRRQARPSPAARTFLPAESSALPTSRKKNGMNARRASSNPRHSRPSHRPTNGLRG